MVVVLQFPFDGEDEIDLTLDILGAPLYIPEFLSSDAEDCITKVILAKSRKDANVPFCKFTSINA